MLRATGPDDTAPTTRATWTRGRRGAVTAASAAVVVLGGVLAACADQGPGGGYVAVGAVGGPDPAGTAAATPTGPVSLTPLDGNSPTGTPGSPRPGGASAAPGTPGSPSSPEQSAPAPDTAGPSGTTSTSPVPSAPTASPTPTPGTGTTVGPAELSWDKPATQDTDQRWCQKVTVEFRNSGGTAVRSGSVTLGTHVIGALGIDWGTIDSAAGLPVPIAPGARVQPSWTVCVDAWRVPLGMHIETRDVTVRWK
ncbi:hypothetical protein BIV25_38910 [Streptomyces sp. MUSC 14]|uniref:hypothetical protein n=1 Tax=Streptomyces sp. MUSC 14 TaxID=1354889 RepID=UPI0008F5DD14|nr:hypothetical protein [Streptomyces sp. MUSC 14]OIJ87483.1 hypothetical protein BIV25_38910 [Streptomyces sp. MUSC 14]